MPDTSAKSDQSRPARSKWRWWFAGLAVLFLLALGGCGFFYTRYAQLADAQAKQVKQREALLQRVGSVVELPGDEPTLLTIADKTKLSNPALALRVENGDTLLVYAQAGRLIVYRPSIQKVTDMLSIDTAPIVKP